MTAQTPARWLRNHFMKRWYTLISRLDRNDLLHFMNYGYSDGTQTAGSGDDGEEERYPLALYHHVASQAQIGGKDLLEVGCGRGGGLAYVKAAFEPRSALGVDLNPFAIDFCRQTCPGVAFAVMDAQALELPDAGFDVVLNVESSHRYPDFRCFVREVFRVLRPGGVFLFADFRWTAEVDEMTGDLANAGFDVLKTVDITAEVCAALRADAGRRELLVRKYIPRLLRRVGLEFAGTPGTRLYRSLETGARSYLSFALMKPAISPAAGGCVRSTTP